MLGVELERGRLLGLEQEAVGEPATRYVVGLLLTQHGSSELSLYRLRRLGPIDRRELKRIMMVSPVTGLI